MLRALLYYNEDAGDESYSQKELIQLISKAGIKCSPVKKKDLKKSSLKDKADFIIAAGGDGTIRKVCKKLLKVHRNHRLPVAILPQGTANNIATSLKIKGDDLAIIRRWKNQNIKKYDVGVVSASNKTYHFFESFGCGLFPYMMKIAHSGLQEKETAEERIEDATELLNNIISGFISKPVRIMAGGKKLEGSFIMAEVMNINYLGPNLPLALNARVDDGQLNVVIVEPEARQALSALASGKINQKAMQQKLHTITTNKIEFYSEERWAHIDDELIRMPGGQQVLITVMKNELDFLV